MKKIIIEKIKVNVLFPANPESSVLAVAHVTLGPIKIKGFTVKQGQYLNKHGDNIWIAPPCNRARNGKFFPTIYIEDEDLWNEIENEIYEEYKRRKEKADGIPIIEESRRETDTDSKFL